MYHNIKIYILIALILIFPCPLAAFTVAVEENAPVKGIDLKCLNQEDLAKRRLIIELYRVLPGDPSWQSPITGNPIAGESILIFGDGTVYSDRSCHKLWVENYFSNDFPIDNTWRLEEGSQCYIRTCKYYLEKEEIIEILNLLSVHEGELLPGAAKMNCPVAASIRIILGDHEGYLSELLTAPIGDEDNLAVINSVYDKVRELEWHKDLEIITWVDFMIGTDQKKEESGWFEPRHYPSRVYVK